MNFLTVAQNGETTTLMAGTLDMCQIVGYGQGKQRADCLITDQTGQQRDVALFDGKAGLPNISMTGQVLNLALSCKQFKGKPSYSGFYNGPSQVAQQRGALPQSPQQAQRQRPQNTHNGEDPGRVRSMAVSYAKDLVVAGRIPETDLWAWARDFAWYIETGNIDDGQPQGGDNGDEIPF